MANLFEINMNKNNNNNNKMDRIIQWFNELMLNGFTHLN